MEQMLKDAQLLPVSASSVIAILEEWGTPTPEWKTQAELLSSGGLHPVAETATSSASSLCKCPHDLDAADMKKLWCEIEFHNIENLHELVAILTHRLWCMSQLGPHMQPTVSAKLQAYAQPQIEWWKRAANSQCERMQNGNILYNLRCVLYADVQTYLAAVAECDRIQDAAKKSFWASRKQNAGVSMTLGQRQREKRKSFGLPNVSGSSHAHTALRNRCLRRHSFCPSAPAASLLS